MTKIRWQILCLLNTLKSNRPGRTARGTHTSTTLRKKKVRRMFLEMQRLKSMWQNLTAVVDSLCLLSSRCCASNRSGKKDLSREELERQEKEKLMRKTCHTQNRKLFLHLAPNILVEQNPVKRHRNNLYLSHS